MDASKKHEPEFIRDPNVKIKVEFDRAPLGERIKSKYLSFFFLKKVGWYVLRLVLLIGIAYIVLFPFISKIAGSFMEAQDFLDVSVKLIPKHFTLDTYKAIYTELNYQRAFINTAVLSLAAAVIQTASCCLISYGLAKFKFKGAKYVFLVVMLTMIIPHGTLESSMYMFFNRFDIRGPISTILGGPGIFTLLGKIGFRDFATGLNLLNSYMPIIVLSVFGLAFKNGLYIFLLRQFFRGVPDELEESAYIDGSGVFKTFFSIIIPLSIPMLITVFLFAFSWQWTDRFYTEQFIINDKITLMKSIARIPASIATKASSKELVAGRNLIEAATRNTGGIMIIAPLMVIYAFCQRFLVQGIERSGLTAD